MPPCQSSNSNWNTYTPNSVKIDGIWNYSSNSPYNSVIYIFIFQLFHEEIHTLKHRFSKKFLLFICYKHNFFTTMYKKRKRTDYYRFSSTIALKIIKVTSLRIFKLSKSWPIVIINTQINLLKKHSNALPNKWKDYTQSHSFFH